MMVCTMKAGRMQSGGAGIKSADGPHAVADQVDESPGSEAISNAAEDRALIAKVRSGDKDAYRRLVEKYQKRAFLLAFDIVRSREDAEDIVQESFVKAYLSLQDFKQEAAFYTWLYRIVYNMAIDYRRKVARRGGPTVEFDERISLNQMGEGEKGNEETPTSSVLENRIEGPQEVLLRRERAEKLREALKGISEEHRVAITLREIDGLSYDEIARTTGVAKGTVMSRLHYARKKIQAAFEEE